MVDKNELLTVTGVRNDYRGPVDLYIQAAEPQERMEVPVNIQMLWSETRSGLERDTRRLTVVD